MFWLHETRECGVEEKPSIQPRIFCYRLSTVHTHAAFGAAAPTAMYPHRVQSTGGWGKLPLKALKLPPPPLNFSKLQLSIEKTIAASKQLE